MTIENIQYFGNARTALKIALQEIGIEKKKCILVPDTICDVLIHPILQLNLVPRFYSINNDLSPDWDNIRSLVTSFNCCALVMVNYFGQPQDVHKFISFCSQFNLLLIEDNAHGYGGYLNNQLLGTFGDIGISSPRKFLSTPSGGVLHRSVNVENKIPYDLILYPISRIKFLKKIIINLFPFFRRFLISLLNRNKNWNNPFIYKEVVQLDSKIDRYSRVKIESADWNKIACQRRENWMAWEEFSRCNGLESIFSALHSESCPWAFPVYACNLNERNLWLKWGVRNNIPLFPWPSLPTEIVNLNGDAFSRWTKMFCFPLDCNPSELGIQRKYPQWGRTK